MAKRRMFSLDVVDTDKFTDMPISAQALYFHLGMRADDDGFVSSPKRIMNGIGSSADDMTILQAKGYVIPFQAGVCVITDWKRNNQIKSDRYQATAYVEELSMLTVDPNTKQYALGPGRKQFGTILEPQISRV